MVSFTVLLASVAAAYCLLKVARVRSTHAALSDSSPNIPANFSSAAAFETDGSQTKTHRVTWLPLTANDRETNEA